MANTLYEYYQSQGQSLPSVQDRSKIYESSGLGSAIDYQGTAQQNTALLNALSSSPAPTVTPTTQATPQANTQVSTVGQSSGSSTTTPTSVQDLINMGYGGYQGWDDDGALADYNATGGSGKMTNGTGLSGISQAPTIDLTTLYDDLYKSSGVADLEAQLTAKKQAYDEAVSKINDNPYLSDATRVGRISKLGTDYENSIATLQNQITTKTADVQNQLSLASQQYSIDSTASQNALTQFNNLLSMGALSNASSATIASLAGSTGLSTDMIQSAITASQQTEANTQVIQSTDNAGNVTVSVINSDTGEVINQSSLGSVGGAKTSSSGSSSSNEEQQNQQAIAVGLESNTNSYGHVSPAIWNAALRAFVQDGLGSAKDFVLLYGNLKDPNREDEGTSTGYILVD